MESQIKNVVVSKNKSGSQRLDIIFEDGQKLILNLVDVQTIFEAADVIPIEGAEKQRHISSRLFDVLLDNYKAD